MVRVATCGAAGKAAGSTTVANSIKGMIVALRPILCALLLSGWISLLTAFGLAAYIARYRPLWVEGVMSSFGLPDFYQRPTYCFSRWKWTVPPEGWRSELKSSFVGSAVFAGLAFVFAMEGTQSHWGTVAMGLVVSAGFFLHAVRLTCRVNTIRGRVSNDSPSISDSNGQIAFHRIGSVFTFAKYNSAWTWFDAVQLIAVGLAGLFVSVPLFVRRPTGLIWPAAILCATVGTWMLLFGVRLTRWLVMKSAHERMGEQRINELKSCSLGLVRVLAMSTAVVLMLSVWTVWNPMSVQGMLQSLAAIQTAILGWIVYRIAENCRSVEPRFVCRIAVVVLVSCFVVNSGVCLANWLPL